MARPSQPAIAVGGERVHGYDDHAEPTRGAAGRTAAEVDVARLCLADVPGARPPRRWSRAALDDLARWTPDRRLGGPGRVHAVCSASRRAQAAHDHLDADEPEHDGQA